MNKNVCLLLIFFFLIPFVGNAQNKKQTINFTSKDERQKWKLPKEASFVESNGKYQLYINYDDSAKDTKMAAYTLDLSDYKGKDILLTCKLKARNVTKPKDTWNGCKFMLYHKSVRLGERWDNISNRWGSFDWMEENFRATISKDTDTEGVLYLGLQDAIGEVWFSDIEITAIPSLIIERSKPPVNPPPVFKGHILPRLRGAMAGTRLSGEDIRVFAEEWGGNLIRWQLCRNWGASDTDRDLDEYNTWLKNELIVLDSLLPYFDKYGVKVALDLHSPPGGRYENKNMAMFYEPYYADAFVDAWIMMAEKYKGNSTIWAFDLINEPTQDNKVPIKGHLFFLELQEKAAKEVRKIDPDRNIIFASDQWNSPASYVHMKPVDMDKVIYQVHMYWPIEYTHQGVYNQNDKKLSYPTVEWNKEVLRKYLQPVRDFQLAYNVHIYVGEFSVIRWAEGGGQYLADCTSLFEEYEWDWSYHAYREWDGWSLEHGSDRSDKKRINESNERKEVIQDWFKKNKR